MRLHFRFPAALIAAALATGCARDEPPAPATPASVSLRQAETADAAGVTVQMIRVDNDSRCASDVTCIWAGNATVVFTARIPGGPPGALLAQQFVNTNVEPRSVDVGGYHIRLDSLTPYPTSGRQIEQGEYRAYLTVSRN